MTAGERPASQRTVMVLNRDLMVGIAISNTAKALGYAFEQVAKTSELAQRLGGRSDVALTIIDMNMNIEWSEVGAMIQSGHDLPPILGFGPHVDIAGRRAAKLVGFTRIVSNGEFHRDMAGLIQRYARATPGGEIITTNVPTGILD